MPLALNSGLFWPRRSLLRYPGTILVEVPRSRSRPASIGGREFLARLQEALEPATARLVRESEMGQESEKAEGLVPESS